MENETNLRIPSKSLEELNALSYLDWSLEIQELNDLDTLTEAQIAQSWYTVVAKALLGVKYDEVYNGMEALVTGGWCPTTIMTAISAGEHNDVPVVFYELMQRIPTNNGTSQNTVTSQKPVKPLSAAQAKFKADQIKYQKIAEEATANFEKRLSVGRKKFGEIMSNSRYNLTPDQTDVAWRMERKRPNGWLKKKKVERRLAAASASQVDRSEKKGEEEGVVDEHKHAVEEEGASDKAVEEVGAVAPGSHQP